MNTHTFSNSFSSEKKYEPDTFFEPSHQLSYDYYALTYPDTQTSFFRIYDRFEISNLDLEIFEQAYRTVVLRHEALRTRFHEVDDTLLLQILPLPEDQKLVTYCDFSQKPNPRAAVESAFQAEQKRPISLSKGEMIRAYVYEIGKGKCIVAIILEHIIADMFAFNLLMAEITQVYQAFKNGQGDPLEYPNLQLKAFIQDKNKLVGKDYGTTFWRERLSDTRYTPNWSSLTLLYQKSSYFQPNPSDPPANLRYYYFCDRMQRHRLQKLATSLKISPFGVYVGIFTILYFRLMDQAHLLLSVVHAGRDNPKYKDLVANCAEPVFLFNQLDTEQTVGETIRQIYRCFFSALGHRYKWEREGFVLQDSCLINFNYFGNATQTVSPISDFTPRFEHHPLDNPKPLTLDLVITELTNVTQFICYFSTQFYQEGMIRYIFGQYEAFLNQIIEHIDAPLTKITLTK